jgi:uncharacterized protein (TIGR00730 family)
MKDKYSVQGDPKQAKGKPVHRIIKNVAFFGDANISENDPVYKDAYGVAKLLAKNGFTIVNGGGPGVMRASTEGAESVKGETLSVTFYPKDAPNYEGKYLGNVTDKELVTSNYIERMFKLMEHADMFVIFKGGSGTISEMGTAWVLAHIYRGHHKPFILFGDFWHKIIGCIEENMNIDEAERSVFKIVESEAEIMPTIKEFEHELRKTILGKENGAKEA